MRLFRDESSNPKWNAQRNLCGITHYVDDDTLRYHKSRVLLSKVTAGGLLFAIVESCASSPDGSSRVFRPVIFNVLGSVIHRPDFEGSHKTRKAAEREMWDAINAIDAKAMTLEAIERRKQSAIAELDDFAEKVAAI